MLDCGQRNKIQQVRDGKLHHSCMNSKEICMNNSYRVVSMHVQQVVHIGITTQKKFGTSFQGGLNNGNNQEVIDLSRALSMAENRLQRFAQNLIAIFKSLCVLCIRKWQTEKGVLESKTQLFFCFEPNNNSHMKPLANPPFITESRTECDSVVMGQWSSKSFLVNFQADSDHETISFVYRCKAELN